MPKHTGEDLASTDRRTALTAIALGAAAGWNLGAFPALSQEVADEITPESAAALEKGLAWLAKNQTPSGNWETTDLGLVGMGALAFMAAGHTPGRGKYGKECDRAIGYILDRAKESGLLNIREAQRDMYNHGLACFVLGQAHGMVYRQKKDVSKVLDQALKLIVQTQCEDGGWDYVARRQQFGHDLSLAVMQAKALRSAVDSGLEVPQEAINAAIAGVRAHFSSEGGNGLSEAEQMTKPGQFTYGRGGGGKSIAMAACGVVCLQEFGQYDDWRIPKNIDVITAAIAALPKTPESHAKDGTLPFDAYTLYYVGQALYQVGGQAWRTNYVHLRDFLIRSQLTEKAGAGMAGAWYDKGANTSGHEGGKPGMLYATAVGCFILAIPNRYLPILQEGRIESFSKPKPKPPSTTP